MILSRNPIYGVLLACLAMAFVSGCGARTADTALDRPAGPYQDLVPGDAAVDTEGDPGSDLAWPALPVDVYADPATIRARRGAAMGMLSLPGSNAVMLEQSSASVDQLEMTCTLEPETGKLSWAMYQFGNLMPDDLPLVAFARFSGELPPGPCFIGISDYATGTWRWTENLATHGDFSFTIGPGEQAISPGGNIYMVIGAWDGVDVCIREAALQLDAPAPPPLGFSVEDGDGETVPVHVSWIDPAVSFDPDGAGPGQYSYDGVELQRSTSPLGPWNSIAILSPGTSSFDDPETLGMQPGTASTLFYEIRTLKQSVLSPWGEILRTGIKFAVNQLTANLVLSPPTGNAGTSVTLNGAGSVHSGPLLTVAWDFEGNGVVDARTTPALSTTHVYGLAGRYYPQLKLIMDTGSGSSMAGSVTAYLPIGDARGDWSQYGRNALHNGRSPLRGPKSSANRKTFSAGGASFYEPAIGADGTVFVAASDSYLYMLNPDLTYKNKVALGGIADSTPAITKSGHIWLAVYEPTMLRTLKCVWPDNTVHSYPVQVMEGEPLVSENGLYVYAAYDSELYCALPEPAGGSPNWYVWKYSVPAPEYIKTPAVGRDGSIYFSTDNYFYKLSSAGKLVWKKTSAGLMGTPTAANDDKVYLSYGISLMAFDGSGANLWQTFGPDGYDIVGAPAIGPDGNIYVCSEDGGVLAIAPLGYPPYPAINVGETLISGPAIDSTGRVYLLGASGTVFCLTKKLFLSWSYNIGAPCSKGTLALGNTGTLYAGGSTTMTSFR